jgi:hypothetical protein
MLKFVSARLNVSTDYQADALRVSNAPRARRTTSTQETFHVGHDHDQPDDRDPDAFRGALSRSLDALDHRRAR